jgi:hypothetical protein
MRWRNAPSHKLLPLKNVQDETGLDPEDVLRRTDTQRLVRIGGDGTREELVRIPTELLRGPLDTSGPAASVEERP